MKDSNRIKILFVCHGNICRSPMAEAIMSKIAKEAGKENEFEISSAAVSAEEAGNEIHPSANNALRDHGISGFSHKARKLTMTDYRYYDRIFVMDESNMRRISAITGNDPNDKIRMLNEDEVCDPWYTGDFDTAYEQIEAGCKRLLAELSQVHSQI